VTGFSGSLKHSAVRRARAAVAVNLAAACGLVVLLVSAIAIAVSAHQQQRASERYVGIALGQDNGGVKFSCLWLFTMPVDPPSGPPAAVPGPVADVALPPVTMERVEGAEVAPPGFPVMDAMRSVAAGGTAVQQTVTGNHTVYLVRTVRVGGQVRQAVFDLVYQQDNGRQMLGALMAAGLAGLVGAGVLGLVLSRRAVRPLVEALDRQQRFVADASHELRAPLTRLHTRAQLIRQKGADLPAPVTTELGKIVRGTRELAEVVDDLLRSTRLPAGARDAEPVDLAALADDLVAAEAGRLLELGITAEVRVGPGRPTAAGVESALRRVLSALVDNAIGHTRRGGWIRVSVAAVDEGRTVELVVADDGVGLDPAILPRIFERFTHGTGGRGPRHGLGLALAREVVDSHHGTIAGTGEPGLGARFVVRLPAAKTGRPDRIDRPAREPRSGLCRVSWRSIARCLRGRSMRVRHRSQ
jgi:signal transduction histidine kinase